MATEHSKLFPTFSVKSMTLATAVVALLALAACAAVMTDDGSDMSAATDPADASGTAGTVSWTYTSTTHTLTFTGTGAIPDYLACNMTPWSSVRTAVHAVVISDGITGLGNNCCQGMAWCTSWTIASSVVFFGDGCLDTYTGTSGVVSIAANVTHIGTGAFAWSVKYSVDAANSVYASDAAGSLYSKDLSTLYRYSGTAAIVSLPASVTVLGSGCFCYNTVMTSFSGSAATAIPAECFSDCSALTSVVIPAGVTSIGDQAFFECSALTSVVIPSGVTSIGDRAFFECSALTKAVFLGQPATFGTDALCISYSDGPGRLFIYSTDWASDTLLSDALDGTTATYVTIYLVTYDYNGGGSATRLSYCVAGEAAALPTVGGSAPSEAQSFVGWAVTKTATEALTNFTPNADVTLYAVWQTAGATTVIITYDLAGGSSALTSQTVAVGSTVTLPTAADGIARDGFVLAGWSASADTSDLIGATVTVTADTTVYAVWTAVTPAKASTLSTWQIALIVIAILIIALLAVIVL